MIKWLKKYNIMLKFLSVIAAVVLWFFVMSVINPEITTTYRNVKVTLKGVTELYESREYSIVSDKNMTLDVTLRGTRNDILKLNKSDIEVVCDVSQITGDGENRIECTVITPNSNISVANRNELKVTVVVDKITEKEISVKAEFDGELEENLSLGNEELSPSKIVVKGPKSEVNSISHAIVKTDISELKETTTRTLPVIVIGNDGKELKLEYSQLLTKMIDVKIPVYLIKEIHLSVAVNPGGKLTEDDVAITITPSKIKLFGERSIIEEIQSISIGMINLKDIVHGDRKQMDIVLPPGTRCLNDSIATVTIEIKNITTIPMVISDIEIRGTNSNYTVRLEQGEKITVRLNGSKTLLDTLTAEDIKAYIDIDSLVISNQGQQEAPVIVELIPDVNVTVLDDNYTATLVVTK